MKRLLGAYPAFIAVTSTAIRSGQCEFLPRQRVVLEVLQGIVLDEALREALVALVEKGYRIAMEDDPKNRSASDLGLAYVVRIDVWDLDEQGIAQRSERLSDLAIKLLADKVDSYCWKACESS